MGQVVDHFECYVEGSGAYCYDQPKMNAEKTWVAGGRKVTCGPNAMNNTHGGMMEVLSPYRGWMFWGMLTVRIAVYKTTTDKCTAPTRISFSGDTMSITGGKGGDLNAFGGYQVQWREKLPGGSWGSWSSSKTVKAAKNPVKMTVTNTQGYLRQYRARTIGAAGSGYYSAWYNATELYQGNMVPKKPVIMYPAGEAVSRFRNVFICLQIPADPDGQSVSLLSKTGSAAWVNEVTVPAAGGRFCLQEQLGPLQEQETFSFKLNDGHDDGPVTSVTIRINGESTTEFERTVETGDYISTDSIHHSEELQRLLDNVNDRRQFFGMEPISAAGDLRAFGAWAPNIEAMWEGLQDVFDVMAEYGAEMLPLRPLTVPGYPTASIFEGLKTAVSEMVVDVG